MAWLGLTWCDIDGSGSELAAMYIARDEISLVSHQESVRMM